MLFDNHKGMDDSSWMFRDAPVVPEWECLLRAITRCHHEYPDSRSTHDG